MMKEFSTDRVSQLEGLKIDKECKGILQDSLSKCFQYFDSRIVGSFAAEISLIVDFLYFRETVNQGRNLPGNIVQNVSFTAVDSPAEGEPLTAKRRTLFFLVSVLGRYGFTKLLQTCQSRCNQSEEQQQQPSPFWVTLKRLLELSEKLFKFAGLINFLAFLYNGRYRCLSERVCGVSLKYINPSTQRFLDFELQNRTIIWGIISDFVKFVLPLANDLAIFKAFSKMFKFTTFLGSISDSDPTGDLQAEENRCGICEEIHITMPRSINACKHVFCYYCITQYLHAAAGKQNIKCPKCQVLFDTLIFKK